MGWVFGVGLSLSILYHPTAVERNGHCADSGPCGALRARERAGGGGKDEGGRPVGQKGEQRLRILQYGPPMTGALGAQLNIEVRRPEHTEIPFFDEK